MESTTKWQSWFDQVFQLLEQANYQDTVDSGFLHAAYKAGTSPQTVATQLAGIQPAGPGELAEENDTQQRTILREFLRILKKHRVTKVEQYISPELLEYLDPEYSKKQAN